jgi:hypothetical protein
MVLAQLAQSFFSVSRLDLFQCREKVERTKPSRLLFHFQAYTVDQHIIPLLKPFLHALTGRFGSMLEESVSFLDTPLLISQRGFQLSFQLLIDFNLVI